MLFILLFLHPGELGHVDETTIENDLSLWIFGCSLELKRLNLSFITKCVQQVLRIMIDIAEDDPLVPLTIGQSQLLESNLVLFGLTDGNGNTIYFCRLIYRHLSRR